MEKDDFSFLTTCSWKDVTSRFSFRRISAYGALIDSFVMK